MSEDISFVCFQYSFQKPKTCLYQVNTISVTIVYVHLYKSRQTFEKRSINTLQLFKPINAVLSVNCFPSYLYSTNSFHYLTRKLDRFLTSMHLTVISTLRWRALCRFVHLIQSGWILNSVTLNDSRFSQSKVNSFPILRKKH